MHLLALSAKSPQALKDLAVRFAAHLAGHPRQDLADVCFTANTGRSHFSQRLALTAASIDEARRRLADWAEHASTRGVASGAVSKTGPGVAMLAGGDGSQYPGMARDLYRTQPVFEKAIEQCEALLGDELPPPLASLFEEPSRDWLDRPRLAHPALVAVEYALAQLWKSWGIEPSALLGQGIGEYTAACLAGVFTLEEALRLVSARARLLESLPADGRMFVVLADSQQNRRLAAVALRGGDAGGDRRVGPGGDLRSGGGGRVAGRAVAAGRDPQSPVARPARTLFAGHDADRRALPPRVGGSQVSEAAAEVILRP